MNRLAIMQGRLSPPVDGQIQGFPRQWWKEFHRAKLAGIDCLEWLYRENRENKEGKNPLDVTTNLCDIREWGQQTGVRVRSVCADYFVDHPLIQDGLVQTESVWRLLELLHRATTLNVVYVVLPFVGRIRGVDAGTYSDEWYHGSRLQTKDDVAALVGLLVGLVPTLTKLDLKVCLESDLPPRQLRAVCAAVGDDPHVRVCYDTGDRPALGYDPAYDVGVLGDVIGAVHIKERVLGGPTVPLGRAGVTQAWCARSLLAAGYQGSLVLQVARGVPGREVEWAQQNATWIRNVWDEAATGVTLPPWQGTAA